MEAAGHARCLEVLTESLGTPISRYPAPPFYKCAHTSSPTATDLAISFVQHHLFIDLHNPRPAVSIMTATKRSKADPSPTYRTVRLGRLTHTHKLLTNTSSGVAMGKQTVDLGKLRKASLKRYKKHFKLDCKADSKTDLYVPFVLRSLVQPRY